MTNTIPDEIDPAGFEARLCDCGEPLKELFSYLRSSAHHAGVEVTARRFRHPEPNSGWGVTYYIGAVPFCHLHPKLKDGHVWILLPGVAASAIAIAGFEPSHQEGWFKIRRMEEAVRFVQWIIQSHDARISTAA